MNNYNVFKVGNSKNFKSKMKITELDNGCLNFFITFTTEPEYSLNFTSAIKKEEFLTLEVGKNINLLKFIDTNDAVVGEDGRFDLNDNLDLKINRCTPHF